MKCLSVCLFVCTHGIFGLEINFFQMRKIRNRKDKVICKRSLSYLVVDPELSADSALPVYTIYASFEIKSDPR